MGRSKHDGKPPIGRGKAPAEELHPDDTRWDTNRGRHGGLPDRHGEKHSRWVGLIRDEDE